MPAANGSPTTAANAHGHAAAAETKTKRRHSPATAATTTTAPRNSPSRSPSSTANGRGHKHHPAHEHKRRYASPDQMNWGGEDGRTLFGLAKLSPNPEKAWAEAWFIAYSTVWPVLFGLWAASGLHLQAGDAGNLLASVLMGVPNILVPWLWCPTKANKPVQQTYWFKFLVWQGVFSFIASFFYSEYFFDVLEMKYHFPHLSWNFDAMLLGTGKHRVPVMMYVFAWFFFITYHSVSIVFIRTMRESTTLRGLMGASSASVFATAFTAWLFSWAEIRFTTMDAIKDQFEYRDMEWALGWGAVTYSCYFLASFPLVQHLDEDPDEATHWSMVRVWENSLAAGMIGFFLLEIAVQFVIPSGEWYARFRALPRHSHSTS